MAEAAVAANFDELAALRDRLESLERHCLTNLQHGLQAMVEGNLTVEVTAVTTPIEPTGNADVDALGEVFNRMLAKTQGALTLYNTVREDFRVRLGDHSILHDLDERLASMDRHCLTDLATGLEAMVDGDLTVEVHAATSSLESAPGQKIGSLGETFNGMLAKAQGGLELYEKMRASLAGLVGEIAAAAGTVSQSSTEMARTSEETGKAVEEIATAVQSVASGAERQVRMVQNASASAEKTAENANHTSEVAAEGVKSAQQASDAMDAVSQSTSSVTEAIGELAKKSEQIGGIVATIGGIAAQTNLLALNAAIEAARAGDQGRGFAVVADEVRKLAEQSQTAASQIAQLINEIQSEMQRTVVVVNDGAKRTAEGVEIVQRARQAFEQIGEQVEQVTADIAEIVTATGEVADVATQSSAATEQVSASTEETSASAEQISASAQQLAATAQQLESLVGTFRLAA